MPLTRLCFLTRPCLLILFCLIVAVSIILTLISLKAENHHPKPQHHWWTKSSLTRNHRFMFSANASALLHSASSSTSRALSYIYTNAQRQIEALKFRRLKTKLFLDWQSRGRKGWKLLPGNVVIHDGHEVVNPHNYAYATNSVEVCKGYSKQNDTPNILIFVESDIRRGQQRQAIRETWALPMLQKALNFRVVFLLGSSRIASLQQRIREEFYTYGDIVQENFTESFKHLALKSIMGLKWVHKFCEEADFVMKTDDDILIHVPNLMQAVRRYRGIRKLLLCHKNRSRQILRRGTAMIKYQVLPAELPGSFFPEYCGGFAYIMSRDTVQSLLTASMQTPYFFIEDVYVTGFCRYKAKIDIVDQWDIALKPHITADQAPCIFAEGRITSQELSLEEMKAIWQGINTKGYFCPVPLGSVI